MIKKTEKRDEGFRDAVLSLFWQLRVWAFAALLLATCWAAGQPSPDVTPPIALRAEPLAFTPKEFYIAQVVDERQDQKAVAYLLPVPATPAAPPAKAVPVDLEGGGLAAINKFVQQSLPQNKQLRPVVVRLKECRVTEKAGAKTGRVDGHVEVAMAFEYQRDSQTIPLVEYRGGARYDRPASKHDVVEPALRRSLADALQYLNTWMDREAGSNEKLAKALQVRFRDHVANVEDDTVFYSPDRPITWSDFQGSPSKPSSFAASIFPSFAYEGRPEVVNGVIQLDLTMKVYVLKSASWVKANARNAYALGHEQRHFDIVKLVAERYKQKLTPERLTLEDYNSIMQYEYIESFREMNRLQEQYDNETRHGIDEAAQARWNQRIAEELQAISKKQ